MCDTAYIFLLRDTLLPYVYYIEKNEVGIYSGLLSRKALSLLAAGLVVIIFLGCRYKDLIRTVLSIKKFSGAPAYQAKVYGDFGLAEYYKVGSSGNQELQN